jgi:hypothetical protein
VSAIHELRLKLTDYNIVGLRRIAADLYGLRTRKTSLRRIVVLLVIARAGMDGCETATLASEVNETHAYVADSVMKLRKKGDVADHYPYTITGAGAQAVLLQLPKCRDFKVGD